MATFDRLNDEGRPTLSVIMEELTAAIRKLESGVVHQCNALARRIDSVEKECRRLQLAHDRMWEDRAVVIEDHLKIVARIEGTERPLSTSTNGLHDHGTDTNTDLKPVSDKHRTMLNGELERCRRDVMRYPTHSINHTLIDARDEETRHHDVILDANLYLKDAGLPLRNDSDVLLFEELYGRKPEKARTLARASREVKEILDDRGTITADMLVDKVTKEAFRASVDACVTGYQKVFDGGEEHARKTASMKNKALGGRYLGIVGEYAELRMLSRAKLKAYEEGLGQVLASNSRSTQISQRNAEGIARLRQSLVTQEPELQPGAEPVDEPAQQFLGSTVADSSPSPNTPDNEEKSPRALSPVAQDLSYAAVASASPTHQLHRPFSQVPAATSTTNVSTKDDSSPEVVLNDPFEAADAAETGPNEPTYDSGSLRRRGRGGRTRGGSWRGRGGGGGRGRGLTNNK